MAEKTFRVAVTKYLEVRLNTEKLDAEFWHDFNTSITDRGGEDFEYLAEHAAWNYVQGDTVFIEGIGPLDEMHVFIAEVDSDVTVEA